MIWPSVHPRFRSPSRNTATKACPFRSLSACAIGTPMRRIWVGLLPAHRERPCRRCTAESRTARKSDELAPLHLPLRTRLAKPQAYHFAIDRRGRNGTQLASETDQARCRRWVKSIVLAVGRLLPLYAGQRTSSDRPVRSGWCQQETHAAHQRTWLFDEIPADADMPRSGQCTDSPSEMSHRLF